MSTVHRSPRRARRARRRRPRRDRAPRRAPRELRRVPRCCATRRPSSRRWSPQAGTDHVPADDLVARVLAAAGADPAPPDDDRRGRARAGAEPRRRARAEPATTPDRSRGADPDRGGRARRWLDARGGRRGRRGWHRRSTPCSAAVTAPRRRTTRPTTSPGAGATAVGRVGSRRRAPRPMASTAWPCATGDAWQPLAPGDGIARRRRDPHRRAHARVARARRRHQARPRSPDRARVRSAGAAPDHADRRPAVAPTSRTSRAGPRRSRRRPGGSTCSARRFVDDRDRHADLGAGRARRRRGRRPRRDSARRSAPARRA